MVQGTSHMFITGPDVVKTVTGEDVTLEELGGAMSHATKSGVATFVSPDEKACLDDVRHLLSFLALQQPRGAAARGDRRRARPAAARAGRHHAGQPEPALRHEEGHHHGGRRRRLLRGAPPLGHVDRLRPHERSGGWGIVGKPAVVLAGVLDIDSSEKASLRAHLRRARIPLLTFVDVPGFMPGTDQEYGGSFRATAPSCSTSTASPPSRAFRSPARRTAGPTSS